MEKKLPFGVLLEDVIGYSHEDFIVDDQLVTYDPKHLVIKGSLVTVMSQDEAKALAGHMKLLPNYKYVSNRITITLHCKPHDVFPITKNQRALLNGVPRENDRIEVLHNLIWVEKLHQGSYVYVTIPTIPTPVSGVVNHIGPLEGEVGTKFGIELQEGRGEGTHDGTFRGVDYFECEPNCAVFVSMDKLTQKRSAEAAKGAPVKRQSPPPQDDKPFRLGDEVKVFDKDGNPIKGIVRSVKKNVLGIEAEKRLALVDIPGQAEDNKKRTDFTIVQRHHTKLFLPAHLVVRYDSHGSKSKVPDGGTKNGASQDKSSQQRKNSGKPDTNGDSQTDINKALKEIEKAGISPGKVNIACQAIALQQFEDEQKQKLAKPKKNKEKIEQQKRIQEAKDELKMDDWSSLDTSLLDIEKQKKILEEATHNKKVQEEKRLRKEIVQIIRLQEEEEEAKRIQEVAHQKELQDETAQRQREETAQWQREEAARRQREDVAQRQREETARRQREEAAQRQREETAQQQREETAQRQRAEAAKQKRVQEEIARQKRVQQEAAQQERLRNAQQNRKTCKTYAANDDNDSQSEEFYDTSDTWPDKQKGSPVDAAHVPSNHDDIIFSDQCNPNHFADQPQENVTPVIKTQPSPQQGYKPIKPDPQPSNDNPHNLEVGAMIQFGNPPCYGVIKWIGSLPDPECVMAGVELEAPIDGQAKYDDGWYGGKKFFESQINRGLFLPLKGLHPDRRFASDDSQELPNPIKEEEYNPKDSYVKPSFQLKQYIGKPKGIQGHQNSCYLDATLYGMFAFSDAFDGLLLEDVISSSTEGIKAREIQNIIRKEIVYRLRAKGVVTYNHIMELREKLDKMLMTKGLIAEEKDPEEFLNLLFKHVLAVEYFLKLRRPSGTDSEFFVQLFVEADKGMVIPTTQDLLHKMFKEQNITFAEYPSRLLIQVPRYGKKYKSFNGIIPSLELDITEICDGATSASHPCYVCGKAGKWTCSQCGGSFFCDNCKVAWHKHPGRENHDIKISQENAAIEIGKLQLLSVLCIETSHYVCFTRITDGEKSDWVFFDSMAERPDDKHNLPIVKRCKVDIMKDVYNNKKLADGPLKALPPLSRRFVEDTYLCIYIDPEGVMYR